MIRYFVSDKELQRFLLQILNTEGFKELESDLRTSMIAEMLTQLENDTDRFIADHIDMQDAQMLGTLIQRGVSRAEIEAFVSDRILRFHSRLAAMLGGFRDFYVQESERAGIDIPTLG